MLYCEFIDFNCILFPLHRISKDSLRFTDELDLLKYVCKVIWSAVFKKEVDNLRTNHQGFYVLHDNRFRLFTSMAKGKQYLEQAPKVSSHVM